MNALAIVLLWITPLQIVAQNPQTFEIAGNLRLIDKPPEATPVEALSFQLHSLTGGPEIYGRPDRNGNFLLRNLQAGHYSLVFPMPGRLAVFATGTKDLSPSDFELISDNPGPLSIVVSMQSTDIAVSVRDFQSDRRNAVVLLVPFDDRLTLRTSCYANRLTGSETVFHFVPVGKYRVIVVKDKYEGDVSAYAPRIPAFLAHQSVTIEASSERNTAVSVSFIPDDVVDAAIKAAGGTFQPGGSAR